MAGTEFAPGTGAGADKITALLLPESAKSIKANATFTAFAALAFIDGEGVETIGEEAFWEFTSLTEVNLPAATTIGASVFFGCKRLTSVRLLMATTIGAEAFGVCTSLTTVRLPTTPPSIGGAIFNAANHDNNDGAITVRVPITVAVSAYTSAWGVSVNTSANGNTDVYGDKHKAVTIAVQ
jgi:hypothetical protein